jgi:hypothetical protein
MIFQITKEELRRFGTLEKGDLGRWCYLINGAICGFHTNKKTAETTFKYIMES